MPLIAARNMTTRNPHHCQLFTNATVGRARLGSPRKFTFANAWIPQSDSPTPTPFVGLSRFSHTTALMIVARMYGRK